jgi:CHAD domain-containing protein
MAFRLDFSEPPESALRICAAERIDDALDHLEAGLADDPGTAVHEARKDVKKTRALLRLHRDGLGGSAYRRENRALRNAGREISFVRDAHVLLDTVEALAERYAGQVPAGHFDALRAQLDHDAAPARSVEDAVDAAKERLTRVRARLDEWELRRAGRSALRKDIRHAYARGRRAFERAERDPSDERLHDWRKRVKDLRYQQQLLRPAWQEILGAQAKAAKQLSERLGDDHDLAVLDQRAREFDEPIAGLEDVFELIERRRRELQDDAFRLGSLVYAEPPKRFAKRIGRYLRTAAHDPRAELVA